MPGLTDHPISSRRRYDHFGTSPEPGILPDMTRTGTAQSPFGFDRAAPTLRLLVLLGWWVLALSGCSRGAGALSEIRERGELRVATLNGPTTYFIGAEGPEGPEYEFAEKFAAHLGVRLVLVVETDLAGLRRAVAEKRADLAAAQLGWSNDWRRIALPSESYSASPLFWVHDKGKTRPKTLADLAKRRVAVLDDSAAAEWLLQRPTAERKALRLTVVPRELGRDPLELVASGRTDVALIDGREFAAARALHPSLEVAFAVPELRRLHWMVRRDGRDLLGEVNAFLETVRASASPPTLEIDALTRPPALPRASAEQLAIDIELKLPALREHFDAAAAETGIDWRLLAALGYQESMWDPKAVSPFGARGLMMLMPRTAKALGVDDLFDAGESIRAGARYLDQLHATVPARIREPDRMWMALASYNMGYGHLEDARVLTARQGGNMDSWLDVRERLTLLAEEFWYLQAKNGYARGFETKMLVDRVQQYHTLLQDRFPQDELQRATPARIVADRQEPAR